MSANGSKICAGRERRFGEDNSNHFKWYFCFGDCSSLTKLLREKSGKGWIIGKFLNALFRGVSQVVFANNPFTGVIVMAAIFWYNFTVGGLVLASTTIAILTAALTDQNPDVIHSGGILFNAVLLSSVTGLLWTPLYGEPLHGNLYIFILVGSAFSVLLSSGLTNILSSLKPSVPILAIPFHILIMVTFACLKPHPDTFVNLQNDVEELAKQMREISVNTSHPEFTIHEESLYNHTRMLPKDEATFDGLDDVSIAEFYSWTTLQNCLVATIMSSGQIFGMVDVFCSLLVYAGMLMYSPILTFMCLQGAFVATIVGLFLTPFPNDEIFLGVYGFNGFLSGGTIALFYVFNIYTVVYTLADATLVAVLQYSLTAYFAAFNMPVFGLPFLFCNVICVCVTSRGPQFTRVNGTMFPELQRRKFLQAQALRNDEEEAAQRNLI